LRRLKVTELARILAGVATVSPLLRASARWPAPKRREWQLRRLQRLVSHAYAKVEMYRTLYDRAGVRPANLRTLDDLQRFPIVTKQDVIAAYPAGTIARGYRLEDLIVSRSSGSSGLVMDIAYDARAFVTYVLAGLRLYRMAFDYRPHHRQVYIYTSPYPMDSVLGLYPLRFIHTLAPMEQVLEALKAFPPDLLVCYPSHLRTILDAAADAGIVLPTPRAVSVNSEMSTQAERDEMSRRLGCPVLDEYSSEELTRIAAQCVHKTYHVFEDINFMEVLDDQQQPTEGVGTVVGTNLHNHAMPMIRYCQGDLAQICEGACACGRRFRYLKNLHGRRNDSFELPDGRVLTSGLLLDATYEIVLTHRSAVRDFCLIQDELSAVRLQVVAGPGWAPDVERWLVERFASLLGPLVKFRVEVVTECFKTATGKRNPIISRVGRDPGTQAIGGSLA
jgi:phenylacetate-CoA ligase